MKSTTTIITLCILPFHFQTASACDTCAIYSAIDARGESTVGWFSAASTQYTYFGTTQEDGHEIPNIADQHMESFFTQVIAGYGITSRFSVQVSLPFINRIYKRPEGFQTEKGSVNGLGDASLTGEFVLVRESQKDTTFIWNLLAGIKLPTGSSSRLKEEFHEIEIPGAPESGIHGHDLALGSGSVDGVVGTAAYFGFQRGFATAAVQYSLRTEGDYDYRYANALSWEGGVGAYLLLEESQTLALELLLSGDYKRTDTFQGSSAADTALNAVYLGPKLIGTWGDKFSADIGIDIPLRIQNSAFQTVPDVRVRAGFTWEF